MTAPPVAPPSSRRARVAGALLLALMFAAGVAGGFAWGRARPRVVQSMTTVDVNIRAQVPEELRRLDLTADQTRQVAEVIRAGRARSDSVMSELGPRLRLVFDSVDARVRAVLTPDQRARLDQARQGRALRIIQESTVVNGKASGRTDTLRTPP